MGRVIIRASLPCRAGRNDATDPRHGAELRERLEENVRSRTRELSEANQILQRTVGELRLARDKAEAANQAKMQFLAKTFILRCRRGRSRS